MGWAGSVGAHFAARRAMADDLPAGEPRQTDRRGIVAGLTGRRGVAANRNDPLAPFADHPALRAAARGGDFWYTAL